MLNHEYEPMLTAIAASGLDPLVADLARQYAVHWTADPLPPWAGPAFCAAAAALGGVAASVAARLAMRGIS